MSCYIRAEGVDFHVDAFIAHSTLPAPHVFHAGEKMRRGWRKQSALAVDVAGTEELWELDSQIPLVMAFCNLHRRELERLRDFPGVDEVRLDVGTMFILEPWKPVHDVLPPDFAQLTGQLGMTIEISHYPVRAPKRQGRGRPHGPVARWRTGRRGRSRRL